MGVDFFDVLQLGTGVYQQIVVNFQPEGADNREIVLDHQIVDLIHRPGGGVFNGQDAILAHALFDGGEHSIEIFEIHDHGAFENLLAGQLGVGPLHSLAGHHGGLGEELGSILNCLGDFLIQRGLVPVALGLVAAAQLKNGGVEASGIACEFRPRLGCHLLQNLPLPGRDEDGQIPLPFVVRHLGGDLHPGTEELYKLVVDFINFRSQFGNIHEAPSSFLLYRFHWRQIVV